ncbi:MAG: hypothetical protein HY235_15935 [Acidobacteria bacterium]|nr:hypothetical protein [Acidobacteriota bacterium]
MKSLLVFVLAAGAAFAAAPRYLYMFHNINSFLDEEDQKLAVEAFRSIEMVGRKHGITVEHFFTGLSFQMHRKVSPELLEELKKSGRDYHHHGANRPPMPFLIARVGTKPWPEAIKVVEDYEGCALDPQSGKVDCSGTGGLKAMVDYFGRPPLSTGRFVRAPIAASIKDSYGVRMGVGTHDWFGLSSSWLWYMGMLNRPDDAFVHPNWDFMEWARADWAARRGEDASKLPRNNPAEPVDLFVKIEQRLAQLDPDTAAFLVFGFHNNDLFGYNQQNSRRFPPEYRKFFVEKMDEFLGWAVGKKGFRPVTLRKAYEMAKANDAPPGAGDAKAIAAQIIESVEKKGTLPLTVKGSRGGHSLAEAWQLLAAKVSGKSAPVRDLLGPTEMAPKLSEAVTFSAAEVRAAAEALPQAKSIPAAAPVAGRMVNAAEFLYAMACVAGGAGKATVKPLELAPPVKPRQERFDDVLSLLQMWTLKPAYFDKRGGKQQLATSVDINIRGPGQTRPGQRPPF